MATVSPSTSLTLEVRYPSRQGMLAKLTAAIAAAEAGAAGLGAGTSRTVTAASRPSAWRLAAIARAMYGRSRATSFGATMIRW